MKALSLDRASLDMRRGACPTLSAPMMTGDGLLVRIALTESIAPVKLAEICRLAIRHGNGIIDISARGNLQVRGLSKGSAPLLDADMRAMNLPLREGLAVEVPPLAGRDRSELVDPLGLAAAIREGARGIRGLAPKMSVIVDGGGLLRLSNLLADIRLAAQRSEEGLHWRLQLGGTEADGSLYGIFGEADALGKVLDLLERLADLGPAARGRNLGKRSPDDTTPSRQSSPFGIHDLGDDRSAAGIGPAFGQTDAGRLLALCEEATALGIGEVKPAFDHSLLFFGEASACRTLTDSASSGDFVISAEDPRTRIAACPGSPACASATIATHELASWAAAECGDLLDGSFKLHVTGCPKGCAHPQPSPLVLCGADGGLNLIAGRAADQAFVSIPPDATQAALRQLAALVKAERRPQEQSAACLARLGPKQIATHLMSGHP